MILRPIRPKPLMPTLMGILPPMDFANCGGVSGEKRPQSGTQNAMGCVEKCQREAGREKSEAEDIISSESTGTIYCGYCLMFVTRSPLKRTKTVFEGG